MNLKVLLKTTLMLLMWFAFVWLTGYIGNLIIVTGTEWYKWPFAITTGTTMTISFMLIVHYVLDKIMNS